jgi:hypothetical protein
MAEVGEVARGGLDRKSVVAASLLVTELFGPGSGRYLHMRKAADAASRTARLLLPTDEAELVTAAAWLHDIGYAAPRTGFHSVDGADLLLSLGWSDRLASLVAHHSFARLVAPAAGAAEELARFPLETGLVHDLIVYGDMSVDPCGATVHLDERLADIRRRHDGSSATGRVHPQRADAIAAAVRRVDAALADRYRPAVSA